MDGEEHLTDDEEDEPDSEVTEDENEEDFEFEDLKEEM